MATTTAQKLVSEVTTDRLIIDMADDIEHLDPDAGKLTLLLRKLNSKPATQEKVEWMETELEDRKDVLLTTQNSTQTLGLTDTTIWHKYDIGIIPLYGFKFIVSSDISQPVKILQLDSGTAQNATSGQNVFKISNGLDEGSEVVTPYEGTVTTVTNMVQIFEQSWQVSESLQNSSLYGGDELARLTGEKRIEHERDIEGALFWGERVDSLASMDSVVGEMNLLGGAEYFIFAGSSGAQTTSVAGSITESAWNTWLADLYTYQSEKPRYIFSSFYLLKALSQWAGGKLNMLPSDRTYGISINAYRHPFGADAYILNSRRELDYGQTTTNVGYEGYNFGLCLDELRLRPQQNLNTKIETNIQNPGAKRRMDKVITYASLEMRLPELHGALYAITGIG